MKKVYLYIISMIFLCSLTACGSQTNENYSEIINCLENKNYDSAIQLIEQMKKDELALQNANKGIKEVQITIDNWDQYFEFGYSYDYYMNSFDEITHINCASGFKLKDEYQIVMDNSCETSVSFEATLESYDANVTYDFDKGSFTVSEPLSEGKHTTNHTTTYHKSVNESYGKESPADGVAGMGSMWQGSSEGGNVQEESVTRIVEVLRAQGTLYIYE